MQQQIYGDDCMCAVHVAETQIPYDQMRAAGMRIRVPDDVLQQYIQQDLDLGLPMWPDEKIAEWKQQMKARTSSMTNGIIGATGIERIGAQYVSAIWLR